MSLNLHLLRLFATVARHASFSRAAETLGISQPAISKSVREFELQVGCRLLDRAPRGVTPTREGAALLRHAETILAAERAAEEELRATRGLAQGALKIGASTTIATYMLPQLLGAFARAHPAIELQLVSANTAAIADLMIGHEIEIALVEGPVDDRRLESEVWRADSMVLVAAPEHPLAAGGTVAVARLAEEVLIVREPGSGSREIVAAALARHDVVPARTLEVGGTEAIKQTVAAGLGVAIVSAATVSDQIALGRLKVVEIDGIRIERKLWRLAIPGRLETPAGAAFAKLLRPSTKSTSGCKAAASPTKA